MATRRAAGSDYLKVILNGVRSATTGVPNLDEPRVKALVEAARALNMLAVAHVESLEDVNVALSAGIDGLAHVWRRGGANPDIARRLAARGVFVTATLAVPDGVPEGKAALLADPRFQSVLSDPIRAHLSRPVPPSAPIVGEPRANVDAQVAAVRGLHEAGVRLLDRYGCQSQHAFHARDQRALRDRIVQQSWHESVRDSHGRNGQQRGGLSPH